MRLSQLGLEGPDLLTSSTTARATGYGVLCDLGGEGRSPSSSSLPRGSELTHRDRRQSVVGGTLARKVGGLGASPSCASLLLCDISISPALSGAHFSDFTPSSRLTVQSNMAGRLLHKVELLVCF